MKEDARFKMLFFETGVGIALVDMDRRILEVNPAFEHLLGYSAAELKGQTFANLMHPEDNAKNLHLHQELLDGKRNVYHMERRYIRKDGSMLWTRLTVSLFRDSKGKPAFTMGTIEDLTEQKLAQQKIQEQQNQLILAAKTAALGELAGGIAHEIQTPLTIIRFRAEALRKLADEGGLPEAASTKIINATESIEKTVVRISSIVKGLRAFARKGEQEPFQRIDIRQVVEEVLDLAREKFKYQNSDLILDIPSESLEIDCRPTQIQQVLVNLLNNALDAIAPLEQRWVRLQIKPQVDQVEISVTDSGNGIPPQVAERLLQPGGGFTTKPVGKGTGLGLSIARTILESHRGELKIDSSCPNTRFILRIPRNQSSSGASSELAA